MPKSRPYPFPDSQAGVQHVISRIIERRYLLGGNASTRTPVGEAS